MINYVYILKCRDNSLYCGYTNNLDKRLNYHNSGKASKYTRSRLPVRYIYIKAFNTKPQALSYEYKIKQLSRTKKLKLISGNSKANSTI